VPACAVSAEYVPRAWQIEAKLDEAPVSCILAGFAMLESETMAAATRVSLRALLTLAWPVIFARATQSVIGFCDALMVAPLGEEPLAAATTGALNTMAFIMLPMGTMFILQSFASQLRGRNELEAIPRYAW